MKFSRKTLLVAAAALLVFVLIAVVAFLWMSSRTNTDSQQSADGAASGAIAAPALNITVAGRVGAIPVVSIDEPLSITETKREILEKGTGRVIEENTPVLLSVTAFDGTTAEILSPGGRPQLTLGMANEQEIPAELLRAVLGQSEGSRLVYVRQVDDAGKATPEASNIEIDVVDVLYTTARGTELDVSTGPLQITMTEVGPAISHGDTKPEGMTVSTVIQGDGPQIGADDRIVVQFTNVGWDSGTVRDSTWTTGLPVILRLDHAMPGLRQSVVDQRIGSRLAITIPPELGTGDDTLCVVMDLLGTEPDPIDSVALDGSVPDTSQSTQ